MQNSKKQVLNKDKFSEVYKTKKLSNVKLTEFISKYTSERGLEIIKDCSTFMQFIVDESKEKYRQVSGSSCKNRFCPLCSYRKARKDGVKILTMMSAIEKLEKKRFVFMTLTYKRVDAEDLEETIKHLNKSFELLFKRKEVQRMNFGYIKKLEVTYEKSEFITKAMFKKKRDYYVARGLNVGDRNPTFNTYHPHFHIILCVNKSYFDDPNYYIPRDKFLGLWQESADDFNITQVDVRRVDSSRNTNKVNELAKYSAKDSDYLYSEEVFDVFYESLKGKRLITFSKMFKDYSKKFDNGELEDFKEKDKTKYIYFLNAYWLKNDYEKVYSLISNLDESEIERVMKFANKEID